MGSFDAFAVVCGGYDLNLGLQGRLDECSPYLGKYGKVESIVDLIDKQEGAGGELNYVEQDGDKTGETLACEGQRHQGLLALHVDKNGEGPP